MIRLTGILMTSMMLMLSVASCRQVGVVNQIGLKASQQASVVIKPVLKVFNWIGSGVTATGRAIGNAGQATYRFIADELNKSWQNSGLFGILTTGCIFACLIFLGLTMNQNRKNLSRIDVELTEIGKKPIAFLQSRSAKAAPGIDHSLPCALYRELFRLKVRLATASVLDESLSHAVGRLEDELGSRGYSVRDLTGQPYHAGMNVKVTNFVVTPGLDIAEVRISRTIRPEITFKGVVIDPGTVEVAVGKEPAPYPIREEVIYVPQNY
jgi:hypothetical protein